MGHLGRLSGIGRLDKALERARRRHGGIVAATHIEDFIDSALGGEDDDAEDAPAGGQAETSVAVDSTGQHIVIGFNDTGGFTEDPVSLSGNVQFVMKDGQVFKKDGVMTPAAFFHSGPVNGWRIR